MPHKETNFWQNLVDYWPAALAAGCISIGTYLVRTVLTNQGKIDAMKDALSLDRDTHSREIKEVKNEVKEVNRFLINHFANKTD